jgi:hypothetical protein
VTDDPVAAAKFVTRAGCAVYKPLTSAGITEADTHRVVFTTPVALGDVDESVRLTAHLLQEWIDKRNRTPARNAGCSPTTDPGPAWSRPHRPWRSTVPGGCGMRWNVRVSDGATLAGHPASGSG